MQLTGLADHQVLQQHGGHALVRVAGMHDRSFTLAIGEVAMPVAPDAAGAWSAELDLPVGGPYEVTVDGVALRTGVLVGDIWILAGQSNMQGTGRLVDLEPASEHVNLLDMSRSWRPAVEPLHVVSASPDPAHSGTTEEERNFIRFFEQLGTHGAGLGLAFGRRYHELTGVPVGLVATAQGGTSLAQWSPLLAADGGHSLYGSFLRSLAAAGGDVAGILWYQGESDAMNDSEEYTYPVDLAELVAAMRRDAGATPFLHVQLGRVLAEVPAAKVSAWTRIRDDQRTFEIARQPGAPPTAMATAVDLDLSDAIHISSLGLRRLGRRLAALAAGNRHPIDVGTVKVETTDPPSLLVNLTGVDGGLAATGHVRGFSVRDAAEQDRCLVFHAEVAGAARDSVRLELARALEPGEALWYGYGLDPDARLVDGGDMAVPAFGPVVPTSA